MKTEETNETSCGMDVRDEKQNETEQVVDHSTSNFLRSFKEIMLSLGGLLLFPCVLLLFNPETRIISLILFLCALTCFMLGIISGWLVVTAQAAECYKFDFETRHNS